MVCPVTLAGNKVYLLRVLEKALQYSPYMDSLGVDYIMEITKPLPEEITVGVPGSSRVAIV